MSAYLLKSFFVVTIICSFIKAHLHILYMHYGNIIYDHFLSVATLFYFMTYLSPPYDQNCPHIILLFSH